MTSSSFPRIGSMMYRIVKTKWGKEKLYYIDFDKMLKYFPYNEKIYLNDDGVLCNSKHEYLNEFINGQYNKWVEETIDSMLTGEFT